VTALSTFFVLLVGLTANVAKAEAAWLSTRGRLVPETRIEAFLGTRTVGAGTTWTDRGHARAGVSIEGAFGHLDRVAELKGARLWQLTETRFATASLSLGGTALIVPDRAFDFGLGPHAGVSLSLGGRFVSVDFSFQTGVELFARQLASSRFPQRGGIGVTARIGPVTMSLMARLGIDLVPAQNWVGRGEVMACVGWLHAPAD
jgi:hypothetical protein